MAHLPYDVAYKIFERLAEREPEDRRFMFPFDHPAMLAGPIRDDAPVHLRTCALVCRSWSLPASTLNIRRFRIWHASADAVTAALSGHDRHLLVQKMEVGREWFCPECYSRALPDGPACRNSMDIPSLLAVLRRCVNVHRLALNELHTANPIDEAIILTSPQFHSVRSLRLCGYGSAPADQRLTPRIFCAMVRLFPSLTHLAVGSIFTETSQPVDGIPPPTFQLQSFATTTGTSGFRGYEWLLHNSRKSIQTVWIYGILDEAAIQSFLNALELGVASLRCFHMHPLFWNVSYPRIAGILQRCTQLGELHR
ncbi:hypothetical protein EXIGLDRAFT_327266 [Exidia glandulosa HHB12029]|uniref:F-box domain-containing protein n=1 Tax=Exidia glandulosa HHB12029 TaxID=1314781 RepID=A0A165LNJ9_EXIGL|nr:hypothetical protein EXIGLDRAFT_327266 [Exidia glandulosa HHB12029]